MDPQKATPWHERSGPRLRAGMRWLYLERRILSALAHVAGALILGNVAPIPFPGIRFSEMYVQVGWPLAYANYRRRSLVAAEHALAESTADYKALIYNVVVAVFILWAVGATMKLADALAADQDGRAIAAIRCLAILAGIAHAITVAAIPSSLLRFIGSFPAKCLAAPLAIFCAAWAFISTRWLIDARERRPIRAVISLTVISLLALQLCCAVVLWVSQSAANSFDHSVPWLPPYAGAWLASYWAMFLIPQIHRAIVASGFQIGRGAIGCTFEVVSATALLAMCGTMVAACVLPAASGSFRSVRAPPYAPAVAWLFPCCWLWIVATYSRRAGPSLGLGRAVARTAVVAAATTAFQAAIALQAAAKVWLLSDINFVILFLACLFIGAPLSNRGPAAPQGS